MSSEVPVYPRMTYQILSFKQLQLLHPSHYAQGRKYEPKDVIRDWQLNFNLGSAIKYISRAGHKDDILQDLKKSLWYLQREIQRIENSNNFTFYLFIKNQF